MRLRAPWAWAPEPGSGGGGLARLLARSRGEGARRGAAARRPAVLRGPGPGFPWARKAAAGRPGGSRMGADPPATSQMVRAPAALWAQGLGAGDWGWRAGIGAGVEPGGGGQDIAG